MLDWPARANRRAARWNGFSFWVAKVLAGGAGTWRGRARSGACSSSVSDSESLGGTSPDANTFFLQKQIITYLYICIIVDVWILRAIEDTDVHILSRYFNNSVCFFLLILRHSSPGSSRHTWIFFKPLSKLYAATLAKWLSILLTYKTVSEGLVRRYLHCGHTLLFLRSHGSMHLMW